MSGTDIFFFSLRFLVLVARGRFAGHLIQSAISLSRFLLSKFASSVSTSLPLATLSCSDCRNSLDLAAAAAAALVTFRVTVIIKIKLTE